MLALRHLLAKMGYVNLQGDKGWCSINHVTIVMILTDQLTFRSANADWSYTILLSALIFDKTKKKMFSSFLEFKWH
ncbi:hypothetical protein Hanom_Chr05g00392471 [Helianthus anomalus]